jgi:hypothetical protein
MKITRVDICLRGNKVLGGKITRLKEKKYMISFEVTEKDLVRLFKDPTVGDNIGKDIVSEILKREWLPEHIAWARSK